MFVLEIKQKVSGQSSLNSAIFIENKYTLTTIMSKLTNSEIQQRHLISHYVKNSPFFICEALTNPQVFTFIA